MNWNELFTNPVTMAAVAFVLVNLFRWAVEVKLEQVLPDWVPPATVAGTVVALTLLGQILPGETQSQIVYIVNMVAAGFAAYGGSYLAAPYDDDPGIAARALNTTDRPNWRRPW